MENLPLKIDFGHLTEILRSLENRDGREDARRRCRARNKHGERRLLGERIRREA